MKIFNDYQNDITLDNFKLIFGCIINLKTNSNTFLVLPDEILKMHYKDCKKNVKAYFKKVEAQYDIHNYNLAFINLCLFYDGELEYLESNFTLNRKLYKLRLKLKYS